MKVIRHIDYQKGLLSFQHMSENRFWNENSNNVTKGLKCILSMAQQTSGVDIVSDDSK